MPDPKKMPIDADTICWGCGEWSATIYCQKCSDEGKAKCGHGREPADCNACMVEGDLAHDSKREGGGRR